MTSINEPFGIVPLEGMAAASAVICSDSGGPAATVQHGVTGLHFRSGDYADLARKVAYLLRNTETARQMGLRGREIGTLGVHLGAHNPAYWPIDCSSTLIARSATEADAGAGKPRRAKLPRRQSDIG